MPPYFIEAWTSLDTALSGGLHITNSVDDEESAMIAVGVDTHKERHYAVALDHLGQMLAELVFAATAAGYGELQRWAEALAAGRELVFGMEGAAVGAPDCASTWCAPGTRCWRWSDLAVEIGGRGSRTASTRLPPRSACSLTRASPRLDGAGFSLRCGRC